MTSTAHVALLIVDDDAEFRSVLARRFQRRGCEVTQTGSPTEALRLIGGQQCDVALLDIAMPEMDGVQLLERVRKAAPETQVIMLTGQATFETAIRAMKLGAYDYLTKPCELAELEVQVQRAYEKGRLARENRNLRTLLRRSEPTSEIIGKSPALKELLHLIARVAPSDTTVLIQGESGTGKELVARALHQGSPRADKPMVVINCAALQETLLESELFGHEKGAFTGAITAKQGLFEVADGGTLFVDEIGEMALGLQAKLLRVLEDGRFRRVGSTREVKTDVRILAATNKDLRQEASGGRFREDLFYRLNVITLQVPTLRERAEDISLLVDHFLARGPGAPKTIAAPALKALSAYPWPGNVRELANVIERGRILAEGRCLKLTDLPAHVVASPPPSTAKTFSMENNATPLHELERLQVERILAREGGNKLRAAKALGISRRKLYRLLEKHAIMKSS